MKNFLYIKPPYVWQQKNKEKTLETDYKYSPDQYYKIQLLMNTENYQTKNNASITVNSCGGMKTNMPGI